MGMVAAGALGARRAWRTARLSASGALSDGPLFLVDYLLRATRVAVLLSLWRTLLPASGAVSGITRDAVLTYTLFSEIFAEQLTCRTQLDMALWEGTVAVRLLQPNSLVAHVAAEMVGRWLPGLALFSLPLLLAAPLLGVNAAPAGSGAALLAALSLALAIAVGLALEFIFGGLVVALQENVWLISRIRGALLTLLSGALVPLALLPWGLGDVFQWLPFASMASAPLRIYTGTGPVATLLLTQAAWCAILWPAAGALWRRYRERLVGYGG